jgi:outer membrane phospholipase A
MRFEGFPNTPPDREVSTHLRLHAVVFVVANSSARETIAIAPGLSSTQSSTIPIPMRAPVFVLFALVSFVLPIAHAARELPATLLVPPAAESTDANLVDVVVINPTASAESPDLASTIDARLVGAHGSRDVRLTAVGPVPSAAVAPGGFVRVRYAFRTDASVTGRVVLEIDSLDGARAVVDLPAATNVAESAPVHETPAGATATRPALAGIERAFAQNFAFHNPVYFIYGPDAPAAKFQFSFKYRILGEPSAEDVPFMPSMKGLYFGYTQRSIWDITAESSPFYDTSYMPEVLFELLAAAPRREDGWLHWLGLQGAAQHESNGRDGADSRSLNIAYLRTGIVLGRMDGWRLIVVPRVYAHLSESIGNADIADYRGYGDLSLVLGKNDRWQVAVTGRIGKVSDRRTIQVDFTHPISLPVVRFGTYLHVQYFSGYGESLRSYDQKSHAWRAGFAFVR